MFTTPTKQTPRTSTKNPGNERRGTTPKSGMIARAGQTILQMGNCMDPSQALRQSKARTKAGLLVLTVALFAFAEQGYAQPQETIWSATLNVTDLGVIDDFFGCGDGTVPADACGPTGNNLSDIDFTLESATQTFDGIGLNTARSTLRFTFQTSGGVNKSAFDRLTLHVGSTTFAFRDADFDTLLTTFFVFEWPASGLSWSVGDSIQLSITEEIPPAAPEFIPAVNDRYDCIMRENPDLGSVVCNSFHPDSPGSTSGVHASAWAYSATDPDGDTLTYSLEGPDADDFNINAATGNVTTKKQGSRYNGDRDGGKRVFRVTLKATNPGGLSDTQDAIVSFEDAFEIHRITTSWTTVKGRAVPWIDLRWDSPWSGGHSTRLKEFEIEFYDVNGNRFMHRERAISKSSRYRRIRNEVVQAFKNPLDFETEYMFRVVARGEGRSGYRNSYSDPLDRTPWRSVTTGSMPGTSVLAPGTPLTATFLNTPESHDGSTMFPLQIEFNATLTTGWEALRDSITITNGTLTRIQRTSGLSHLWYLEITPTSESFITIALAASGVCDGANGICAAERVLEEGITTKIYGTRAVTTVTNAEISNGPGENGTWDVSESVTVEVTFSSAVTIGGATIGITLDGVRRDAAFTAYIGDTGARFSYPVTAADAGATQALLVSNSLDARDGLIGDSGGGDVILDFEGEVEAEETIEPDEDQEPSANALTAEFQNLPDEHDGNEDTFSVQVLFDAALSGSWTNVRDAITVTNGTHTGTSRVDGRNDLWKIEVEATSDADVTVRLAASVACGETGALCTSDSRRFEREISTVIDGPDEDEVVEEEEETPATALTASLSGMPYSHDGETGFRFRIRFSEALASSYSYRTMRDRSVVAVQGTTSIGASNASRVNGSNAHWEVTITPQTNEAIAISFTTPTDCTATGAMCSESGVALSSVLSATVKGPPGMTIADATVAEATGAMLHFDITLEHAPVTHVLVQYATSDGSAIAGSDYIAKSGTLVVGAGEILKRISVPVLLDSLDEDSETMTLTLSSPSAGATLSNATATGTITNDGHMPRAWLTRFGRTIGSQAVDAIGDRISGKGRSHVQVGGITLSGETRALQEEDDPRLGIDQMQWQDSEEHLDTMSPQELLLGSTFQLSSGGEQGTGSVWTAWGQFATGSFEAEVDDTELDGNVVTGFLGADVSGDRWLGGLALSISKGDGNFSLMDDEDSGEVESTLTSVYPYARIALSDKVDLWGMVGAGEGDVTLMQLVDTHRTEDQSITADIGMRMGAIGIRGEVLSPAQAGGVSIAVKSDAFMVKITSDAVSGASGNLAATKSDASRIRLAVEGARTWEAGAGSITPSVEVGVRHDGGDAETGTGVELGGGLRYEGAGVSIEGAVRTLIAHEDSGYEEWGASGSIRIDPGTSGRGVSFTLAPSWGNASSGMDQIWSPHGAHELSRDEEFEARSRLQGEIGYGLTVRRIPGVLTPYTGMTLGDSGGRAWRIGARWQMGTNAALGLEARNAGEGAAGVTLRARVRF